MLPDFFVQFLPVAAARLSSPKSGTLGRLTFLRGLCARWVGDKHADALLEALIALNEAYAHLMTRIGVRPSGVRRKEGIVECAFGARGVEPAPGAGARASPPAAARNTIGRPKDPAYAYYKQGFLNYSLAVHGIAAANQIAARGKLPRFRPYRVSQDFANSLELLGAAHGYFTRVADEFPDSVWNADACVKLKRIERFTKLYRKILANVSGK